MSSPYQAIRAAAHENPRAFWEEAAQDVSWIEPPKVTLDDSNPPFYRWFVGGKINGCYNAVDRHVDAGRGAQTAIIYDSPVTETIAHISYAELQDKIAHLAGAIAARGIGYGDRVIIYMPMIPEAVIAMLACARIGAVHSVVFGGFAAAELAKRIDDATPKMILTASCGIEPSRIIAYKPLIDEAIETATHKVSDVIVMQRPQCDASLIDGRDHDWDAVMAAARPHPCVPVNSEDPAYILYTSGTTGTPKGVVRPTGGHIVALNWSMPNIYDCRAGDVYWAASDVGWVVGHSYIVYAPLFAGCTTVLFEGKPVGTPDATTFWRVISQHKVRAMFTAPTAIRALAKESLEYVQKYKLETLKVIGSVGEPINEEAWHWYNDNIGKGKSPIIDSWWQTETGGIMITPIPYVTPTKPTYATLPFIGIQPAIMDENGEEIIGNQVDGRLCIKFPWPSIARTIWGDHKRYRDTYFTAFENKYFTGDGALRDEVGYYRITGRVDDVIIVSGHNLGTAPIEDAINEHQAVAESAIVGFPHDIKGNALYGYVILKETGEGRKHDNLRKEINQSIADRIGPIAKLDKIQFTEGLPKTRSVKIMRRILRKIAEKDTSNLGDISTLLNPEVVQDIMDNAL